MVIITVIAVDDELNLCGIGALLTALIHIQTDRSASATALNVIITRNNTEPPGRKWTENETNPNFLKFW